MPKRYACFRVIFVCPTFLYPPELKPVRAGLVSQPESWPWSSAAAKRHLRLSLARSLGFTKFHFRSVSEIEFCTLYVVAERWILGCILRFMHGKNDFSDTLSVCPRNAQRVSTQGFSPTRYCTPVTW
jgi:hypothetical protein